MGISDFMGPKKHFEEETRIQRIDSQEPKINQQKVEGKNRELYDFLWKAYGISRIALNIFCLGGAFIFGVLLIFPFQRLRKTGLGLFYWILLLIFAIVTFGKRALFETMGTGDAPTIKLFAAITLIIYLIAWIHANVLLSKYIQLGKERLVLLERLPEDQLTMNLQMEKGLIQLKVLYHKKQAFEELRNALQYQGGDNNAQRFVGDHLFYHKQYNLAQKYYERALLKTDNKDQIEHIKKMLSRLKKIKNRI
jgi:hypothetical protein